MGGIYRYGGVVGTDVSGMGRCCLGVFRINSSCDRVNF
jgi:hypothetical protein